MFEARASIRQAKEHLIRCSNLLAQDQVTTLMAQELEYWTKTFLDFSLFLDYCEGKIPRVITRDRNEENP